GAGPIGVLCTAVASDAGAAEIVVTDLQDLPLAAADALGANRTLNIGRDAVEMDAYCLDKGYFDVVFECSAAEPAIRTAIGAVRPQGKLVQVGMAGDVQIPLNLLVGKEVSLRGTFRFHSEFEKAVKMISADDFDLAPIISKTFPMENSIHAFDVAGDRSQAVKVQLSFL
ncbi:MAG: zinc-binding dehydrogenase, partial [Paracoccaceae bacterium]|nr:zinc-binding dehydrogenase [Paracoccaceae bacterium]